MGCAQKNQTPTQLIRKTTKKSIVIGNSENKKNFVKKKILIPQKKKKKKANICRDERLPNSGGTCPLMLFNSIFLDKKKFES